MIKILIVDDCNSRTSMIKEGIANLQDGELLEVDTCVSSDAARRCLVAEYDLLILDVCVPKKDDGVPQAKNGIALLNDICGQSTKYIRPGLIVGITANISDIDKYKEEFYKNVAVVLDGALNKLDWLRSLEATVVSLMAARRNSSASSANKLLITIHGIRTYGKWQELLKRKMEEYSKDFKSCEIKYGYFDLLSFSIPLLRERKSRQIAARLNNVLSKNQEREIHVVAHSYGTHILSRALASFDYSKKLKTIILCGSPLPHSHNIDHIVEASELTINECGSKDFVLVLARTMLLGLGDAGRVGFTREQSEEFMNRYYVGGHSMYFEEYDNSRFYERYWVPVLAANVSPDMIDHRSNYAGEDLVELLIRALTAIKPALYLAAAALFALSF